MGSSSGRGLLPANHLPVPVHRDVGPGLVVIRSKVTVGGSKPLVESVLQGVELRPVAQMPRERKPGHFRDRRMGAPELQEANTLAFREQLRKQGSSQPQGVLSPGAPWPGPPARTVHPGDNRGAHMGTVTRSHERGSLPWRPGQEPDGTRG